ncbi:unnamed protein product [Trichobilharzia regenti]|nr:unnamed protein product [Trichobilharzia regenti]
MQRSLLNFFSRSSKPLTDSSNKTCPPVLEDKSSLIEVSTCHTPSNVFKPEVSSEDLTLSVSKRRRVIIDSSDEDENETSILSESKTETPAKRDVVKKQNSKQKEDADISQLETSGITETNESCFDDDCMSWTHLSLPFLDPCKIKDANGRKPDHPNYDPCTLYVPEEFKFYEMYHMDAMVGVKELGLVFMKGNFAHCGFPEVAFARMADQLVHKTESVDAMTERCRGKSSSEKVVRREICQLITPGTCTASTRSEISDVRSLVINDGEFEDENAKDSMDSVHLDSYLLALTELQNNENNCFTFGIGLLNASTGKISYFPRRKCDDSSGLNQQPETFPEKENWPSVLLSMLSEDDPLGRTVKPEWELAYRCLGALVYYLRYCLIDHEVMSLGYIDIYVPPDVKDINSQRIGAPTEQFYTKQSCMVLDSITLSNLDIIRNNADGSQEGTLLQRLNTCCTFFGKFCRISFEKNFVAQVTFI